MSKNMGENAIKVEEYVMIKDFRLDFDVEEDGTLVVCFWVYLINSIPLPATIIRQVCSDSTSNSPFLAVNEKKEVQLFPLLLLHNEAPVPGNTTSWTEVPHLSLEIGFPFEKWVHIGCEMSSNFLRLHINGDVVGEKPLISLLDKESISNGVKRVTLAGIDGDGRYGYVHHAKALPLTWHVKDHFVKNLPLQLSIDKTSASEIEEDGDGVWSIVGGKASCRRNFSLDVVLLDASGRPINKEMEIVASLLYADNGAPVEKTSDAEAPLLTSYDGIEFASCDRPSKLLHGRASLKLKISQLSSKCDNRLFRIRFDTPNTGSYPFLEAFSHPIRCISRNRNTRPSTIVWKKSNAASSGSQSYGLDDASLELQHSTVRELKPSPSTKRARLGRENGSSTFNAEIPLERSDVESNSRAWTANQVENTYGTSLEGRLDNLEEEDISTSDSESSEVRNSTFGSMSSSRYPTSDTNIFKYCLGGLTERSVLLKEIANSVSNEELLEFSHQVSLFSGCSHHRRQILISKRLIEEGTKVWNLISQNQPVQWETAVFEIEEHFMKIACCSTRCLTQQDFELLRKIAGCGEYLTQENFEKMWCWLYPVAFTLSREWVNAIWKCTNPKWIEGFITKEEAESSLQDARTTHQPGTFVLRFPTSRSWPHPDAGSLVVSYIGRDYKLHHRLLSLDYIHSSNESETNVKPLQDMLLAEPELSQLGRIIRSH